MYANSKDLAKRTISHRANEIALKPTYDGFQRGLPSMVYKFFTRKQDQN